MRFRSLLIGLAALAASRFLVGLMMIDGPAKMPAIVAFAVLVLGAMVGLVIWGLHSGRAVRKDPPSLR